MEKEKPMNDADAKVLNMHLKSIAEALEEISETLAKREKRSLDKAAKKAQKRAAQPPKK
jgi:hypothetical protein